MPEAAGAISALLERHAAERGERAALVDTSGIVTYAELEDRSARLAGALHHAGLEQGERVALFLPFGAELYVVLCALLRMGAVAVFVEPGLPLARMRRALSDAAPTAFIGVPRAHALRLLPGWGSHLTLRISAGAGLPGAPPLASFLGQERRPLPSPAPGPDAPALLTFTSGTTGAPRAAVRSHGLLLAQHEALAEAFETEERDVELHGLPIFVLHTIASGGTAVLPRLGPGSPAPTDAPAAVDLALSHGATTITGSPTFVAPLAEHCRRSGEQLSGVRAVFVGGAAVPTSLVSSLRELLPDGDVVVVYGSTEAEPIATLRGAEIVAETAELGRSGRGACVGRPVPAVRVELEPVDGDSPVGEVLVSGAHVLDTAGTGRHATGDVAYRDDRGRLWLVGRAGEAVATPAGERWPLRVEGAAEATPGVKKAALAGVGGRALLALETLPGAAEEEVAAAVEAHLEEVSEAVDEVRIVESIPVDARHRAKVDRRALVATLEGSRHRISPLRWLAAGALALLLLGAMAWLVDFGAEDLSVLSFDPTWLALAIPLYLPCLALRARRMFRLSDPASLAGVGGLDMASALAAHAAANHLLPMRVGELTYATLLRGAKGTSFTGALGATALMRLADLVGLGVVVGLAAPFAGLDRLTTVVLSAAGATLALIGAVGLLSGHRIMGLLLTQGPPEEQGRVRRALGELREALAVLEGRPGDRIWVLAESAALWIMLVVLHWALGLGVGLHLSLPQMAVAAQGAALAGYLPVASLLNLGTMEAGWVATLAILGVAAAEALPLGLGVHLGLVGVTALYGAAGVVLVLGRGRSAG